ncbi:MAG TPA: LEPR-XLL domain-containing protein [Pirellulales bacterium]|jgi:hypothetical protein|nr:LEPR-XLL domain-containing protein [Pirellulales bacterium]
MKFRIEQLEPRLMLSRATPTLTTSAFFRAGSSAIVGHAIPEDTAVLSGGNRPTDGILFKLYAPNGNVVDTEWVNVRGNGAYHTSSLVVAQLTGVYTWHARYYGDWRNNAVNDQGGSAERLAVLAVPPPPPPPPVVPPSLPVVTTKPHGYQTFYTTAAQDTALPSTQAYYRYDWSQIEPAFGVYDFSAIEADLAAAEAAGQQFNFRIMPYEDGGGGPVALKNAGLPGSTFSFNGATTFQPDLDSAAVQADLDKLLAALGARFGANTATIDFGWWGSYGEWTNWGTSPALARPSTAATEWLISETEKYFPHSYSIIQESLATDDPAAFSFAMTAGCGVRYDGWGDWSTYGQWSDQNNEYPTAIAASGDQWKRAPIILEPWGTMSSWIGTEPWQQSFDWAVNTAHAWMFSNKSSGPIPTVMQSDVNQLLSAESLL